MEIKIVLANVKKILLSIPAAFIFDKRMHMDLDMTVPSNMTVPSRMRSVYALTRSAWQLGWKDIKRASCKQSRSGGITFSYA